MADYKKSHFDFLRVVCITGLLFIPTLIMGQTELESLAGKWERVVQGTALTIVLAKDGTYEVEFTGDQKTDVTGKCTIENDRITFKDTGGMAADAPGIYTFKIEEDMITFSIVNDPSNGRSGLLAGTWIRKKN